jgi:hypothetical protein
MDDPIWHATIFTKNRDRLLEGDIARAFFDGVVAQLGRHLGHLTAQNQALYSLFSTFSAPC